MDRMIRRDIVRGRSRTRRPADARVEALESRALLAGVVQGSWPGPHNLPLTLENGSLSTSPGQELTINAAQYAQGGNGAIFSGAIIGPPNQPFHGAELRFRNFTTPAQPITTLTNFTPSEPSPLPNRLQVRFSGTQFPLAANVVNRVRVVAVRDALTANAFTSLPGGNLRILVDTIAPTVASLGPIDSPRDTAVSTVNVTTSEAVQLGQFTFEDLTLTRDNAPVPLDARVTVAGAAGSYQIAGLESFTGTPGTYQLTVAAGNLLDVAGNPGTGSRSIPFVFDPNLNVLPAPPPPVLQGGSDSGFSPTDNVTATTAPAFVLSGVDAATTVRLLRDGVVVGSRVGPGSVVDPLAPVGSHAYTAMQVNAMGIAGRPSTPLTVVVDPVAPTVAVALDPAQATFSGQSAATNATTDRRPRLIVTATDTPINPANILFASLLSIDGAPPAVPTSAPPVLPGEPIAPLAVPSDLGLGQHTAVVQVVDAAGNAGTATFAFTIVANPALSTPGTPVFSTIYDLDMLEKALDDATGHDHAGGDTERPWSMSFDRTTQTIWAVVRGDDTDGDDAEGGNRLVQLDPATGRLRAWSLQDLDPNSGPHGVFFDFETHLTPRVWFTQRTGDQTESTHAGRLSYLDLATNQFVSYDLRKMLIQAGYKGPDGKPVVGDLHAVHVDRRGVVWVSDQSDQLLLELDFRGGDAGLASTRGGKLIVHQMPPLAPAPVSLIPSPRDPGMDPNMATPRENVAGPHGIEVVVDDRTDTALVYFTTIIEGRFNLLRPGVAGGQDQWYSWDVDQLIRDELGLSPEDRAVGAPIFPTIDTNETPGRPEDDRIYFGDPGFPRNNATSKLTTNNVIRELTPGNLLLDPDAASSPIRSWRLPAFPGSPAPGGELGSAPLAQINQTFLDREGNVLFIDRRGGIGRLDTDASPGSIFQAPIVRKTTGVTAAMTIDPIDRPASEMARTGDVIIPLNYRIDPAFARPGDISGMAGLDQYQLVGMGSGNAAQGTGPFRGALTAGGVVFTSLTQGDQLSSTVFAEEARRETAVVATPDGARKVFQVLRDGRIVLTERGAGSLIDRQSILTRSDPATGAAIDPPIVGDVAAVVDAAGSTHVFGRDASGGLVEYFQSPATGAWTSRFLGRAANVLAGNPQAFLDPIRGAGAFATTGNGHLIAFFSDNGEVIDLTDRAGKGDATLVYSKVGTASANGLIYAYGTNQLGDLIEYALAPGFASADARKVDLPAGVRDLMLFQDLEAVAVGGTRHVFGSDGASRLVHVAIRTDGTASAENVTELTKDLATGYSAYQQPFAGRIYGGANAIVAPDGQILVYGTNGRDLVEFRLATNGVWSAENLTNRPANRVFGNPSAYVTPNGDRHILMINEDSELVEYYQLAGLDFATYNITLAQGNNTSTQPPSFPNQLPGTANPGTSEPADDSGIPGFAATPLAFDAGGFQASRTGQIGVAGDRDVFRFVATRTGRIVVNLKAAKRGLDTVLRGLNAATRQVARNDDLGRRDSNSRIVLNVVAGRTYYLVASAKPGQTGDYTLTLRYVGPSKPAAPARAASVQVPLPTATGEPVAWPDRPWKKGKARKV